MKAIAGAVERMTRYVVMGLKRIFSPTDDQYPNSGVQPYEGTPYHEK